MKKKMLAAAIASALAVPSAFAAIDDAGMKYTSASEGLYGSLRFALRSREDQDLDVHHESSRFGMQGDVDVGHGNTAFYRAEWRVTFDAANSQPFSTRLAYVGMKGAYGSVRFGQIWSADYDYVTSLTDVTNNVTGNLAPRFRVKDALRYDSPDIQGFRFAIQVHADDNNGSAATPAGASLVNTATETNPETFADYGLADRAAYDALNTRAQNAFRNGLGLEVITIRTDNATPTNPLDDTTVTQVRRAARTSTDDLDDGNDFDRYILAAGYSIRGINFAATYVDDQAADGSTVAAIIADSDTDEDTGVTTTTTATETFAAEDTTSWGIGANYGQDNWKVGYHYWDTSDYAHYNGLDLTGHSVSGQVSFDKVTLRAVFDTQELEGGQGGTADTDAFTLEAQYSFSSKARAYATYQNVDTEEGGAAFYGGAPFQEESDSDLFYVAYRVDF